MTSTFEEELRSWLLQTMRSAFIISPRFQDYKISQVDFPAGIGDRLTEEIKRIIADEKDAGAGQQSVQKGKLILPDMTPSKFEKILEGGLGGPAKARTALSLLSNPTALFSKILTSAGGSAAIAALLTIPIIMIITKELVRKGSVFDRTFKNYLFDREEALRTREIQQRILVGFDEHSAFGSQLIITTMAGTTNPGDSFNTYEVINRDYGIIEDMFSIRSNDGI